MAEDDDELDAEIRALAVQIERNIEANEALLESVEHIGPRTAIHRRARRYLGGPLR